MGRPPSNGGPAFRFTAAEVSEMENILQQNNIVVPSKEVLTALAEKFSESDGRKGKIAVQMKQVWNWFQNKRYAIRARSVKVPGKLNVTPMTRDESGPVKSIPLPVTAPAPAPSVSVPLAGRFGPENSMLEFEAKSGRDGAWYDVTSFMSHRHLETGDPEVLVHFAGFGPEEDEWVNVRRHVRPRSLPCESSECVAVLPGDLILCFQEGQEQALYYDAHVLDAQRRRHDVRGCRCRFLVRYDHDQSEEIVPLRKVCRRPETDYRLQQLHGLNETALLDEQKISMDSAAVPAVEVSTSAETMPKERNTDVVMVDRASSPVNVPVPSQAASLEQKNTKAAGNMKPGNCIIPQAPATFISNFATSSGIGSIQKMPEEK